MRRRGSSTTPDVAPSGCSSTPTGCCCWNGRGPERRCGMSPTRMPPTRSWRGCSASSGAPHRGAPPPARVSRAGGRGAPRDPRRGGRPAVRSPHRRLEQVVEAWSTEIPATWESLGRPFERALVERAVEAAATLGPDQGEQVLLHQDMHGGNVLRAQRQEWLAIDPKPLIGEREFDLASLLRDRRDSLAVDPQAGGRVRRRLDLLAADTGLDRERLRGWAIVHALAWGMDG